MATRRKKLTSLPIGRFAGPPLTIVLFLVVGYLALTGRLSFLTGGGDQTASSDTEAFPGLGSPLQLASTGDAQGKPSETLAIATFNIQVFGVKKAEDLEVMQYLALILRQFDVIAVQEIRSLDRAPVDQLLSLVNSTGEQYQVVLSERLGRTDSKEQYAYIWDSRRVEMVEGSNYLVNDDADFMHREPFVASFRALQAGAVGAQPFSFTMINVHTDPDETDQELNVLDDVFQSVRAYEFSEDDFILAGDLNVETIQLGELGQIQGVESVNREQTNTAGSRSIDHILIDRTVTTEFRSAGVINYERDLKLPRELADRISDHRPVWAVFDSSEHAPRGVIAAVPGTTAR
ncbi:Endonuclease/Exonuclease/phosphatase family protein [Rosistilla ulvae]|uniref:Endonuclease/Exonuclease/phosphatase family protein n=1 Tax=Rosistilla ulvae TaxID=1930277 RepID=A0A517M8G8_9BACT|nr:endonuclease/exonuclease/phosphatase family protein [Rosistilla ulvae]QDS91182.1 Endonuclease/Exonuclease/phosphatase family protein [Rosistilla ulvae]